MPAARRAHPLPIAFAVRVSARPRAAQRRRRRGHEPVENFTSPGGFPVLSIFTVEGRVTTHLDAAGNSRREVPQIAYERRRYSKDHSRSIPDTGRTHRVCRLHRVFDCETLMLTVSRRSASSPLPGAPTTGRRETELDEGPDCLGVRTLDRGIRRPRPRLLVTVT